MIFFPEPAGINACFASGFTSSFTGAAAAGAAAGAAACAAAASRLRLRAWCSSCK